MAIEHEYIARRNLPLCDFAKDCFYGRRKAKISIGDYHYPETNEKHIYVSVDSIDDYAWGAWKHGVVFRDEVECKELFRKYMQQLPVENGKRRASEENFEAFFKRQLPTP